MSSIVLEGVTKRFGGHVAADDVDLVIPDGKFSVFVGPSGCGKTTLLRLIAGLEQIDAGRLLIDGIDMADTSPAARGLAMVFQSYALYPHMTVRGNLGFALRAARASKTEIVERVTRVAKMLDLDQLLDRRPAALSGGQRQRVAIGRALVREPRAFLFDEPLSNLDAELRAQMRFEIRRLQQTLGVTAVYVTHDQAEAMTMADQIAVFRAGRIEQVGTPLDIYRHPVNRFVAGFIGSPKMNFLEASAAAAFGAASIGIRPQHITLDPAGATAATMETIEHLGSESFAHVRLPSGEGLVVRCEPGVTLPEDAAVRLRLDPAHIYRFDADGTTLPALPDDQLKEAAVCISTASC